MARASRKAVTEISNQARSTVHVLPQFWLTLFLTHLPRRFLRMHLLFDHLLLQMLLPITAGKRFRSAATSFSSITGGISGLPEARAGAWSGGMAYTTASSNRQERVSSMLLDGSPPC